MNNEPSGNEAPWPAASDPYGATPGANYEQAPYYEFSGLSSASPVPPTPQGNRPPVARTPQYMPPPQGGYLAAGPPAGYAGPPPQWGGYAPARPAPVVVRKRRGALFYSIISIICLVVLIVVGLGVNSLLAAIKNPFSAVNGPTPAQVTATAVARLYQAAPCPFKPGQGIVEGQQLHCGYLTVPEDRANPQGPKVKLAIATFRSTTSTVPADPFIYLAGGPGGSTLSDLGAYITAATLDNISLNHELVLLDQRGTGYSTPSLACQERADLALSTKDQNLSRDQGNTLYLQATQKCHDRLVSSGIHLNAYTTIANATDVHEMIAALHLGKVDLYGVSYGTRLALTFMRLFPADLRDVVLDSTVPTQINLFQTFPAVMQHAYDTFFQGCASSVTCNQQYPQLDSVFYKLVTSLNAKPITFQDQQYGSVLLNGDSLAGWLFSSLYVTSYIPALPKIISQVDKGDYSLLGRIYGQLMLSTDISYGMYYSVECGEDMAFTSIPALDQAAQVMHPEVRPSMVSGQHADFQVCQTWGDTPVPAVQKQPVVSSVPTLILSGEFDPITPLANAELAKHTLSQSYLFRFPATGHGVFLTDSCPDSIIEGFFQNPGVAPNSACIASMSEPSFL